MGYTWLRANYCSWSMVTIFGMSACMVQYYLINHRGQPYISTVNSCLQLAGDNATLSSNVNSSIENQSPSVAASSSAAAPSTFLRVEDTTPQGSMNNKLDTTSLPDADTKPNGQTVVITDLDAPDDKSEDGEEPNVQIEGVRSPASQSTDSVSQSLLKNDDTSPSSSSNSDFEIVNENAISI